MTPKSLILDLFSASGSVPIAVKTMIRAAAVFDIPANRLRVALTRLTADGALEPVARGVYALRGRSASTNAEASAWRDRDRELCPWSGGWLAAAGVVDDAKITGPLHRLGFRSAGDALWLRPDNLRGGAQAQRARLQRLDIASGISTLLEVSRLEPSYGDNLIARWDITTRTAMQMALQEELEASLLELEDRDLEGAARETFVLGGRAIRALLLDPLLPEVLAAPQARRALEKQMRSYDEKGRKIWSSLLGVPFEVAAPHGPAMANRS